MEEYISTNIKALQLKKDDLIKLLQKSKTDFETKFTSHINYINNTLISFDRKLKQVFSIENSNKNEAKIEIKQQPNDTKLNTKNNEKNVIQSKYYPNISSSYLDSYINKTINKKFQDLLQIHNQLFISLKNQIWLFTQFLEDTNIFFKKNPLEYFIEVFSENIMDSWLFSHIDFSTVNLSHLITKQNHRLNEIMMKYTSQIEYNKFKAFNILQHDNVKKLGFQKEFLKSNFGFLKKIKMKSLHNQETSCYDIISSQKQTQLNKLEIKNCINFPNFNIATFNEIEKVHFDTFNSNFNFFLAKPPSETALLCRFKELHISNCQFNDKNYQDFLNFIINYSPLQKNLSRIALPKNNLTNVVMTPLINKKIVLESVIEINFENNNIYNYLIDNFVVTPKLKILNLSNNNISSHFLFKIIKEKGILETFVILNNNLFISNNKENNEEYFTYFKEKIKNSHIKLKALNMTLMFNKYTCDLIKEISISPSIRISLKKLNLRCCGLNSKILVEFLKDNEGFLSLKTLQLDYNLIDNSFFEIFAAIMRQKESVKFEELQKITLRNNLFTLKTTEDFSLFCNFISKIPKLGKVNLRNNVFETDFFELWNKTKNASSVDNNNNKHNPLLQQIYYLVSKKIKLVFNPKLFTKNIDNELVEVIGFKDKRLK